jgi:hypothetical protein
VAEDGQGIVVGDTFEGLAIDRKDLIALLDCPFLGGQPIWKHSVNLSKPRKSVPETIHVSEIHIPVEEDLNPLVTNPTECVGKGNGG